MKAQLHWLNQPEYFSLLRPCWGQLIFILAFFTHFSSVTLAQNKQWDKTIGGSENDILTSIQQTNDGGYILGGSSFSAINGDKTEASKGGYDYWIVKLNALGQKEWDKTLGGSEYDILTFLQQTSDGGYILGGWSHSSISGDKTEARRDISENFEERGDYWVVKLSSDGEKQWDKTIGGSENDRLSSVQQTKDGGYILGGYSESSIGGDKTEAKRDISSNYGKRGDYWVVKLNANGQIQWDRTIGGSVSDQLAAVQQTRDGGFILGGWSESGISGDKTETAKACHDWGCFSDYWVVKLDADGRKAWDKTIGGTRVDQLTSVQQTSDGGFILGGWSYSDIGGDKTEENRGDYFTDYWIVKLNTTGEKQWDRTFGGDSADQLFSVQQTSDGGYILGGWSYSDISGDKTEANRGICGFFGCSPDYWIVKLNTFGHKQWDKTMGGDNTDEFAALQQTKDGGYILGGWSDSPISGDKTEAYRGDCEYDEFGNCPVDYWVVKLDNPNACNQAVTSFALVNADTHKAIRPLIDGDIIDLSTLPTENIKISARTNPGKVGSVVFHLDGKQVAIENLKPYRYGGRNKLKVGTHTLTATPYCEPRGKGAAGQARTLQFTIIRSMPVANVQGARLSQNENSSPNLQASPNPFSGQTTIQFSADEPGEATLEVYDLKGALVERLFQQVAEPGRTYTVYFNQKQLPAGVYIARLTTQKQFQHLKLLLSR